MILAVMVENFVGDGAAGVTGSMLGPRASGMVFMLLYQAMNAGQAGFRASSFVRGGTGALSAALALAQSGCQTPITGWELKAV